jgi:hypothetical protein
MNSTGFFNQVQVMTAAIRSGAPISRIWENVQPFLNDPDVEREFWSQLEVPEWILFLQANGRFDNPPKPVRSEQGIQHSVWWASKYLAKMARNAPGDVASVFASIQTTNASIVGDMLDAALAMPPENAASLVEPISRAIKAGLADFKSSSDLCMRLAKAGRVDDALKLADALFNAKIDRQSERPSDRDEYWYKVGLEAVAPLLTTARPDAFLSRLCHWLRNAVDAKEHVSGDSDFSYIWRPAVEEHEQNEGYDFAGNLVGLVRRSFEEALNTRGISLDEALAILEAEKLIIFKRLRIHLINLNAKQNEDLARQTMLDRSFFDNHNYKHEYAMLMQRRFSMLDKPEQLKWYGWVEIGPDMSGFDKSIKERLGRDITEQDRIKRKEYWQFERLHWVREYLEGERKIFYHRMFAEYGEPLLADLNTRHGQSIGNENPIAIEELSGLSLVDAIERISKWRPKDSQSMRLDQIEGLAAIFRGYIGANSERCSAEAMQLKDRPIILIHTFIEQMATAAQEGKALDIAGVLSLCEWLIQESGKHISDAPPSPDGVRDRYWQWARDATSRFVEMACKSRLNKRPRYPIELRGRFTILLKQLIREPVQSNIVSEIKDKDIRLIDYLTRAMNSPRGRAVEALLEYAGWVAEHVKEVYGKNVTIPGGFAAMPEVREMIEWNIENPSFVASAMIGARFGLLYWIDKGWLKDHAGTIFGLENGLTNPSTGFGWIAWNAFLVWTQPFFEYYQILQSQYSFAVEHTSNIMINANSHRDPVQRLGEHLIVLYGRGHLSMDAGEGLLRRFVANAAPEIRCHAIEFVGDTLSREEALSADIIKRFQELWDYYWPEFGQHDVSVKPKNRIGSWFECRQFPSDWYLQRLYSFVEKAKSAEIDRPVIETLLGFARNDVAKAIAILDRMLIAAEKSWRLWTWREPVKKILELGMKADRPVREHTEKIIDRLGRLGVPDLGDLLSL